jgi:PAS domain S-box-containing protein
VIHSHSERGLVLAPVGRDAVVACGMLAEADVSAAICYSVRELVAEMNAGAGFALVTEEALRNADLRELSGWIETQPEWSDIPFVLLTSRGGGLERNPTAGRWLQTLGNVAFLERPFHPTTLVSVIRSALRARRRQYEARSRLESLRQLNDTLEARVAAALAEQKVFADIVESTDAFVQVVDLEFRFIAINRASAAEFERNFGVRPKVGDSMLDLLADMPEHRAAVKAIWSRALAGEEFTEVDEFGDPARERRYYEMKFNTLRNRAGEQIGAYQFVYDVTQRLQDEHTLRHAQDALRHAQKMEALGQLTGGVAHDFNNLLMAVSSGLHLIDRQAKPERRRAIVDTMRQAVERGAALTRQLLAFSRRRPLEQRPIDLRRHLLGMSDLLDRSLGGAVNVKLTIADDLWPVEVDPGELELAVLNLCLNSRDAMPGGGSIVIGGRNCCDQVELTVADSGSGMSEEVVARVFEPFFTTKEVGKGSGLGLAQVYAFASQSGGDVSIESKRGCGTTVTMRFPRYEMSLDAAVAELADSAEVTPLTNDPTHVGHVLLVEDDREVAALTAEMLDSIGFEVTHVTSPSAALGALANGRAVDIVFSDVMMPGGMSGVELSQEIRRRRPEIPVVLTTGYIEAARDAILDGQEVLVKPYQLDELARVLSEQLALREQR